MAPVTRGSVSRKPDFISKKSSEALYTEPEQSSWELTIPETTAPTIGNRAVSESRSFDGSYQEDEMMASDEDEDDASQYNDENMPPKTLTPDDAEDILHPLREAANRVGREVEQFAASLDRFNPLKATNKEENENMAFEVLKNYQAISTETVQRLRKRHPPSKTLRLTYRGYDYDDREEQMDIDRDENSRGETTSDDLERWKQEANTWDLLRRLMDLKHGKKAKKSPPLNRFSPEGDYWKVFLNSDNLAAERATVLDWLKNIAQEDREEVNDLVHDLQQQADRGDLLNNGWLYTKLTIKKTKDSMSLYGVLDPKDPDIRNIHLDKNKAEVLITQLDPDALCRQKLKLEPEDIYFERAIWLGCYEMLRRGTKREKIKEWCEERSEIWRAVSMSGLPDLNNESRDDSSNQTSISLWRRMCYTNANRPGAETYEKAVYGVLSGDLNSVLQVSRSWDDVLYAHYNSLLTSQFEHYLRGVNPDRANLDSLQSFAFFDSVQYHGEPDGVAQRLLEGLRANEKTKIEAKNPMKQIQGVLIANEFEFFIEEQGWMLAHVANTKAESNLFPKQSMPEWLDVENGNFILSEGDFDSLRVLTHILLVYKSLGFYFRDDEQENAVENVIVAYIHFLKLAGMEELIPVYAVQLSEDRMYAVLSRILIDVLHSEQRKTLILLMEDLGIDVQKFVKMQMRCLTRDYLVTPDEGYPAIDLVKIVGLHRGQMRIIPNFTLCEIPRIHLMLIRSLEWYLLVDGLWKDTFDAGSELYKLFFRVGNLSAAELLSKCMPSSSISQSKSQLLLGQSLDLEAIEAASEFEIIPDAYEDDEALEEAQKEKRIIRYMLDSSKCFRELEMLERALYAMDEFAVAIDDFEQNPENKTREKANEWRTSINAILKEVRSTISPLLQNWLTTPTPSPELPSLRLIYLPDMILGFIYILEFSGNLLTRNALLESMDLATVLADEENGVLELFVESRKMGRLVEALAGNALGVVKGRELGGKGKRGGAEDRFRGWGLDIWGVEMRVVEEDGDERDGEEE